MVVPYVTSDHVPLLVQFGNTQVKSKLFRMENHWLQMEEIRSIIQNSWGQSTGLIRSAASLINLKMRRSRAALRRWKRSRASLDLLISNNKNVVLYLDDVEERRSLSLLERVLRTFATDKSELLIL